MSLRERIGDYEGILIRSGTEVDEDLLAGLPGCGRSAVRASASTTWTLAPRPNAGSWSSTRLSRM